MRTHDGFNIGALSVMDVSPRMPAGTQVARLAGLAELVMDELELRLMAQRALAGFHDELERRERREEHIHALMRELAHRSKNLLAVVQVIARQTTSASLSIDDWAARLTARVRGLAERHDLIADEHWHGVCVDDLADRQLAPFIVGAARFRVSGPRVVLSPTAAQHVGLAFNELATNAVQHGALSKTAGLN